MKILHTSDLHLGKRLYGVDRLEAQRAMMAQLIDIARTQAVGLVVIAGDIFDTATPSAEAENIFYDTVTELGSFCTVLVISGNHDDADRLMAARGLAARHNIVICGDFGVPTTCASVIRAGDCYVKLDVKGVRVNAVLFPYPTDTRMGGEIAEEETYADRVRARLFAAAEKCFGEGYNLLVTHLFCLGAVKSGSERDIELGTARIIPLDCLPACDYVALGHIHKQMRLAEHIYYSGAPMPYGFDELAPKYVLIADTEGGEPVKIELKQADELVRGTFSSVDEALGFLDRHATALADVTLRLDRPVLPEENRALKARKNLINLQLELTDVPRAELRSREGKTAADIFREYCAANNVEATDDLLAEFLRLMGEE